MPENQPDLQCGRPAAQELQIIWLQNSVEHYFSATIDALNRQAVGMRFHAVFLCERPDGLPVEKLPMESTYSFLPARLQRGPIARGPIGGIPFSAAIVGGYNSRFKLRFIGYCDSTRRPAIMFADSNIRSERGKAGRKRLKRFAKKVFFARLRPKLALVITCNRFGVAYWRYYGMRREQICRSTYFCDVGGAAVAARSDGDVVRRRYGISPGSRLIFTAARLVPEKALHLMIRAFSGARLGEKGWIWVIAGAGPLRGELAAAARLAAGDSIRFLGLVPPEDVKALARHSDIFVLPSTYEPHGIVVSESMAVGTPVIASDACGAAGDLVVPGKTGWIFRNGSAASLAAMLFAATDSPGRLRAMRIDCERAFADWYGRYGPVRRVPEIIAGLFDLRR